MADGDTIIIRGGSAEVEFDPEVYKEAETVGKKKKFKNTGKKITKVMITGDITFESDDHPSGLTCEITAFYK